MFRPGDKVRLFSETNGVYIGDEWVSWHCCLSTRRFLVREVKPLNGGVCLMVQDIEHVIPGMREGVFGVGAETAVPAEVEV